ncbi:helix-turn-helix domain-containing protein [Actinomyces marmotae]|uniref:helix-turn-helix domain-containing protein n=1 Tax=Actinomyces marmotae TaxID=2737173 RepID=UPI00135B7BA0|nr:XRE family transcriptional regulator [Actinomyces marmotae]
MKIAHMETVKDFAQLGEQIRRIRQGRGLDQGQLAARCRLERTALSRAESGERKVSALELTRIAEALDVDLIDLVARPSPDARAARRPVGEAATRNEREEVQAEIDLDRAWRDLCQLREAGLIEPVPLAFGGSGLGSRQEAQELARRAREHLEAGSGPLDAMTDVASRLGLWARTTSAQIDGRSLTPEPGLGVAVVGADVDPGRRRTTLAHEIGHHLAGDTYEASGHYAAPREAEELVDAFAAELLLPEAAVRRAWDESPSRQTLVRLAGEYRVSWSLLMRVAQGAGLDLVSTDTTTTPVDADFYRVLGARPQEDVVPPGLPRAWIQACYRAIDDQLVTPRRAAEMTLGVLSS